MVKRKLKGVAIGAGYFSHFQYEAWNRIPEVEISAMCNRDIEKGKKFLRQYNIPRHYSDYKEMLEKEKPDFVDIITPPETHLEMSKFAADRKINIICQKPLAPTFQEAEQIVTYAKRAGIRFMVHENWRFQPWYREIKKMLDEKVIGEVHSFAFRKRMGDGWGEQAYIPRQPYFREYPRLIVYENGIHFIDTFRYLFGDIHKVYAVLRKLNPVIKGEDQAIVHFVCSGNINGIWDANRYNEPNYDNPRYTFGEFLIDGFKGSLRLYADGNITVQPLGKQEQQHEYHHQQINFSGDCVYFTQRHFTDCLMNDHEFETNGQNYLKSLYVQEKVYESASKEMAIAI